MCTYIPYSVMYLYNMYVHIVYGRLRYLMLKER